MDDESSKEVAFVEESYQESGTPQAKGDTSQDYGDGRSPQDTDSHGQEIREAAENGDDFVRDFVPVNGNNQNQEVSSRKGSQSSKAAIAEASARASPRIANESFGATEDGQQDRNFQKAKSRSTNGPTPEVAMMPFPKPLSRQVSTKAKVFTRPAASHEDSISIFSFSKANPIQPLAFGIKARPIAVFAASEEAPIPGSTGLPSQALRVSPSAREAPTKNSNQSNDAQPIHQIDPPRKGIDIPFPKLHSLATEGRSPLAPALEIADPAKAVSTTEAHDHPLLNQEDTLLELETKDQYSNEHRPSREAATDLGQGFIDRGPAPQVLKSQKKRRSNRAPRTDRKNEPSQQDIMHLMMFKAQQIEEEREGLIAAQEAQQQKIEYYQDLSERLKGKLQDVNDRLEAREANFRDVFALKSRLQSNAVKLGDCLSGLSNDHNRLRDEGQKLRNTIDGLRVMHKEVQDDRKRVQGASNLADEAIKRERVLWSKSMDCNKNEIDLLQQTIQNLQAQLQHEQKMLEDERARHQQLEQDTGRASFNHEQLLGVFKSHNELITNNVAQLLERPNQSVIAEPSASHTQLTAMLEKCLEALKDLRNRDTVKHSDLRSLEVSMKTDTKNILSSVQSYEDQVSDSVTIAEHMGVVLKEELHGLTTLMVGDRTRSEQVVELREMSATVHERLQASEVALRDARLEAGVCKNREQEFVRHIANLEAQLSQVRNESSVRPDMYLRLQDLETRNRELTQESSDSQGEVSSLFKQLQQKDQDIASLNDQLSGLQLHMEDAQADRAAIQEDKTSYQIEASAQRDELRKELSRAANMEMTIVKSELRNALRQLRLLQISAAKAPLVSTDQVDMLKASSNSMEKTLAAKVMSLQSVQAELQTEREEKSALLARLENLEKDKNDPITKHNDKDNEIARLKSALGQSLADIEKVKNDAVYKQNDKEAELAALKASLKRPVSQEVRDQNTASAKENHREAEIAASKNTTEQGLAQEEKGRNSVVAKQKEKDAEIMALKATLKQQRSVNQGFLKRTVAHSNYFESAPRVIKDTHVEEVPRTMAEIMSRDAWSPEPVRTRRNEHPSSTTMTDRAIAGLFPSTPGATLKETRISRTSVSREKSVTTYTAPSVIDPRLRDKKSPEVRQVEDSKSQNNGYVRLEQDIQRDRMSNDSIDGSANTQATRGDIELAEITAANTLAARGTTKGRRERKRSAAAAELMGTENPSVPKRTLRTSTRTNKPAVTNSQSSGHAPSLTGSRPLKLFRDERKGTREGKMSKRFSEALK